MKQLSVAHLIMALLLSCGLAWAQLFATAPATARKAPQPGDEIVIPAGTQIPIELTSSVSSRTAYAGQPVYGRTTYPVTVSNRIVIPVGAYVQGTVTQVVRPGRIRGKAQLGFRFESITLPSGVTKSFNAILAGFAGNGKEGFKRSESKVEGEGTKGKDAGTVAVSGAEGAGIGSIAGISGGHSGAGAAVGAAGGALGGLIWVLATRGKEIVLRRGTDFQLELNRPLIFYRYQLEDPSHSEPSGPAFQKPDPGPAM
ncbi:MAG: hypothetical protein ACRD1O_01620 [Terriglobia bacterium]